MGTKSFIKGAATALGVIGAAAVLAESGVLDDLDLFGFMDSDEDDSDNFFGEDDDDDFESGSAKYYAEDKNPESFEKADTDLEKLRKYVRDFYFSENSGKHAKKLKKKLHKLALRAEKTSRKYDEIFGDDKATESAPAESDADISAKNEDTADETEQNSVEL